MFGILLTIILLVLRSTSFHDISLEMCFIPMIMSLSSAYGEVNYKRKIIKKLTNIGKELDRKKKEDIVKDISKKI